jgi:two-component system cell cycle response regulator
MSKDDDQTAIRVFNPRHVSGDKKKQAALLVLKGPMTGRTIYLETKTEWKVGRSPDADIVFLDDSISRFHFQAVYRDEKWMLEDLNSVNGTFVNGERVTTVLLQGNEKVQLGSELLLKFVLQDEIEAAFQKELYDSATKDSLTGLDSKRYFLERLEMDFIHHGRTGQPLSIVLLDLDHFKRINDTRGHLAGDSILSQMGALLLKILRKGDSLGRYGGEELVFALRDTPLAGAATFAERLRTLVEEHKFVYENVRVLLTASFGVATYFDENFADTATLLKAADLCLYQAKRTGRNKVITLDEIKCHNDELNESSRAKTVNRKPVRAKAKSSAKKKSKKV